MSEGKQKVIIDTDCGIDDAMALMLALSNKSLCEVVGITCCFGNCKLDDVCKNVMRVLTVCGETEIPVYRGCSGPFVKKEDELETVHGTDGLGNVAHEFATGDLKESDLPAPLALLQWAKKYPQEITLIAIGPLTNVAVAHRMEPQFTHCLKSMVIMGGNYKGIGNVTEVAEFNFFCDPECAHIVLTEAACPVTLVPWETTMEHGMEWAFSRKLVQTNSKKGKFLQRITEYVFRRGLERGKKKHYDCDLLAVAAYLYPECVTASIERAAAVECRGKLTRGLTVLQQEAAKANFRRDIRILTGFEDAFLNNLRNQIVRM